MSKKRISDSTTAALKIPPHSEEAERSVLGGLMLNHEVWDQVIERVQEKDFYHYKHSLIFRAMGELSRRNSPIDIVTVTEALKAMNQLDAIDGEAYLYQLLNNTPGIANIVAYADIVRERSILRQLIQVSNEVANSAFSPDGRTTAELLDVAERKILTIGDQDLHNVGPVHIKTLTPHTLDKIDTLFHAGGTITGLPTSYDDLDQMTSGLQPSDLIIVAGRPSMGKTSFAMNIAEHIAVKHVTAREATDPKLVLVFSMEMPADSLVMRMLSSLSRVDQHHVRTGKLRKEDWARITSTSHMLSETRLFIDDSPALTPGEVRARARRITKEHGPISLIVIDYLQLMQVPGQKDNRVAEISEISRSLKALAKELKVPVVALSQLNRGLEQRQDKRPVMSDLRESGAIEQDADLILFIYRDEVYNADSPDKGSAEIIIAKQRNGPIGKVRLTFLGSYTRFENFVPNQYE